MIKLAPKLKIKPTPKFKTRCAKCGKYTTIKRGWRYCMPCWERDNGKYKGDDRDLYVPQVSSPVK